MTDRLTLDAAEAARIVAPESEQKNAVPLVPHEALRASIALALESVSNGTKNSYSRDKLADRQEILDQRRRETLLRALEAEEDFFAGDPFIDLEVTAGAHLDELHTVLDELEGGRAHMTQEILDDMVVLMTELRNIMPELPPHLVTEIREVATPLRGYVDDFQNNSVVVI